MLWCPGCNLRVDGIRFLIFFSPMEKSFFTALKFNSPYPAWAASGQTLTSKLATLSPLGRHKEKQASPANKPTSPSSRVPLEVPNPLRWWRWISPFAQGAFGIGLLWDVAPGTSQGIAASEHSPSLRPNSPSTPLDSSQPHLTPLTNCFSFCRTSPHSDDLHVTGFTGFLI